MHSPMYFSTLYIITIVIIPKVIININVAWMLQSKKMTMKATPKISAVYLELEST